MASQGKNKQATGTGAENIEGTLRVEIVDDDCKEGEAHIHNVSLATSKFDIIVAIETLYPTATSIWFEVE